MKKAQMIVYFLYKPGAMFNSPGPHTKPSVNVHPRNPCSVLHVETSASPAASGYLV